MDLTSSSDFDLVPLSRSDPELCLTSLNFQIKNMYNNVLAPDESRVVLNDGTYINANFVNITSDQRVIASQAPFRTKSMGTESDFWKMVLEYQVPVILMLTPLQENGKIKSSNYWPREKNGKVLFELPAGVLFSYGDRNLGDVITSRSILVENENVCVREDIKCEISTLRVIIDNENPHTVTHFYYYGWNDFSVPDISHIQEILLLVTESWISYGEKFPIICHCSAGIGRTGVIVTILRCLSTSEDPKTALANVRKQRHGLVQTKDQFRFILNFLKRN